MNGREAVAGSLVVSMCIVAVTSISVGIVGNLAGFAAGLGVSVVTGVTGLLVGSYVPRRERQ
jgi:hypothetical protein